MIRMPLLTAPLNMQCLGAWQTMTSPFVGRRRCKAEGVHSDVALEQSAVGLSLWKVGCHLMMPHVCCHADTSRPVPASWHASAGANYTQLTVTTCSNYPSAGPRAGGAGQGLHPGHRNAAAAAAGPDEHLAVRVIAAIIPLICLQAALDKGLILDNETQRQLLLDQTYAHMAPVADGLVWPPEPLRSVLIRAPPAPLPCWRRPRQFLPCAYARADRSVAGICHIIRTMLSLL